ncbi:MAG: hypothetical protein M1510_13425 [Nitrospirae bacterium]|nr:hypothetical protein [Nitrospirota bacterium]MCL5237846.1 hypothetical protein [Nitrospirota bacterium]
MVLGILVNTDRHPGELIGIARAAVSRGHEVVIFAMDSGTKLLAGPVFAELCGLKGITAGFCDYNAKALKISTEGLPRELARGSQYDNAVMVSRADRIIVL